MVNVAPLGTNVLVKAEVAKTETDSGIVLPDTMDKEKPQRGRVVGIGSEVKHLKNDDVVIFKKYSADEIEVGGVQYLIIDIESVLAIVKP